MFVSKVLDYSDKAEELAYLNETIGFLEAALTHGDPSGKIAVSIERLKAQRKELEPRLTNNGQPGVFA
jgi:hypothetical protein